MQYRSVCVVFFISLTLLGTARIVAAAAAPSVLVTLLDQRAYNRTRSMPVTIITDATPRWPPPSELAAVDFAVPAGATCSALVVDLGLLRVYGATPANYREPAAGVSVFLWRAPLVGGANFSRPAPLLWAGNVSLSAPACEWGTACAAAQVAANHYVLGTYRLALPGAAAFNLTGGSTYWLGVGVRLERAFSVDDQSYNQVRWMAASPSVPAAQRFGSMYRVVDVYGNAVPSLPALRNWTNATAVEQYRMPFLVASARASGTNELAVGLWATCTSVPVTDPRVVSSLPALYTDAVPALTPPADPSPPVYNSPSPSPTSSSSRSNTTPTTSPTTLVNGPTSTPTTATTLPVATTPPVKVPTLSKTTPTLGPVQPAAPSPEEESRASPMADAEPDGTPSPSVAADKTDDDTVELSVPIKGVIIGGIVAGLIMLMLGACILWLWLRRRHNYLLSLNSVQLEEYDRKENLLRRRDDPDGPMSPDSSDDSRDLEDTRVPAVVELEESSGGGDRATLYSDTVRPNEAPDVAAARAAYEAQTMRAVPLQAEKKSTSRGSAGSSSHKRARSETKSPSRSHSRHGSREASPAQRSSTARK